MSFRSILFLVLLLCGAFSAVASRAVDSTLFTIPLSGDSTQLLYCGGHERLSATLTGPTPLGPDRLLFFSTSGYVLFDGNGTVIDSHSVFRANRKLADDDPRRLRCAYPLDSETMLFYRQTPGDKRPLEIYRKRFSKRRLRKIRDKEYRYFSEITSTRLFNLARNSIADEMASRSFLLPQMVGFERLEEGRRWWSVDRFFGFSSPVVSEKEGAAPVLFPGLKQRRAEGIARMAEPVQLYGRDGRTFYFGCYPQLGTDYDTCYQYLYFVDHAGNVLLSDTLLKQEHKDVLLGEDEREFYTLKQARRVVFQPTVDRNGIVYYGIMDFDNRTLEVHRRVYPRHRPVSTSPDLAHLIDQERRLSWKPVFIRCTRQQAGGKTIPSVTFVDETGAERRARAGDLTREGFIVRISRESYRDLERKLAHRNSPLPDMVDSLRRGFADISSAGCPYALTLSGPRGMLRSFDYAPGEEVLSARVIAVRDVGDVVVRVDLENYAEILLFGQDGSYLDRFVFNRQPYMKRRDIVVASSISPVIELDYVDEPASGRFLRWEPVNSAHRSAEK